MLILCDSVFYVFLVSAGAMLAGVGVDAGHARVDKGHLRRLLPPRLPGS